VIRRKGGGRDISGQQPRSRATFVVFRDILVKRFCRIAVNVFARSGCHNVGTAKKLPTRPHLRAWRLAKGWKLVPLAEQLGVAHSCIIAWEQGKTGVDDATFASIANAYGITVAELSVEPSDAPRARSVHRLLEALRSLDERRIARLADLAEDLAAPNGSPQDTK
jgi:transcriptional regulator with XRE-family HTH domain